MKLYHPPQLRRRHHQNLAVQPSDAQGVPARGAPVPDPVLLQLIAGLAARRVVCFIVVLLWSPRLSCPALRGSPFWKHLQVTTVAVMRLPEVLHRWSHWQLLSHFRHPNKTGIICPWALPAFVRAPRPQRAATRGPHSLNQPPAQHWADPQLPALNPAPAQLP